MTESRKATTTNAGSQMRRGDYTPSQVIVEVGTIMQALFVVSYGVLVNSTQESGHQREVARLATGDYFGESGLLTGEPLTGQVTALTRAVIYEISKEALSPLLKARPGYRRGTERNFSEPAAGQSYSARPPYRWGTRGRSLGGSRGRHHPACFLDALRCNRRGMRAD